MTGRRSKTAGRRSPRTPARPVREGAIDDDLAFASPWGFELERVAAPVLLAHGGEDRVNPLSHAHYMLDRLPNAELWLRPRDGHVSILDAVPLAMEWLRDA